MSQSLRILFVLVFSCFVTHNAQASFPNSVGDYGIRKIFKNDWFGYDGNRLKLLRADDSAVTFFNANCKNRKKISAEYVSTAMENGMAVAKYMLLFNKKAVPHCFYLICKDIPSVKDVKFKESVDAGRLMKALELLSHGMGDGDVMLGKTTYYVSVVGKNACTSVMSITQYPITTTIIDGIKQA